MKNVLMFRNLLPAAALALGLAVPAFAGDDPATPAAAPAVASTGGHGLLGQNYASLGYVYTDISDTSVNASGYKFALNQGVRDGLDTLLEYDYLRSDETGFGRASQQILDAGVRGYVNYGGLKPYAEAGVGWAWLHAPAGARENSFVWFAGVGAELQAAPDFSITPFVRFSYANSFTNHQQWDYGVKANYWVTEHVGLMATLSRDNSRDMSYGAGVNFRF